MTHEEAWGRFDEYVDGTLAPAEARALEEHLTGCPACRAELEKLTSILNQAAALRGHPVRPERDLWPGVLERVRAVEETATAERARSGRERSTAVRDRAGRAPGPGWIARLGGLLGSRPLVWAPAAGIIVVAFALIFSGHRGNGPTAERVPPAASPAGPAAGPATGPTAGPATGPAARPATSPATPDAAESAALAELQSASEKTRGDVEAAMRRNELPGDAGSVFERNLAVLDAAIRDSKAALDLDPQNRGLQRSLLSVYQKQLDLLRWAARLMQQA